MPRGAYSINGRNQFTAVSVTMSARGQVVDEIWGLRAVMAAILGVWRRLCSGRRADTLI